MTVNLATALCQKGLTVGFAEVRRFISSEAITVNGQLATSWDQEVKSGDVLKIGKSKECVVD